MYIMANIAWPGKENTTRKVKIRGAKGHHEGTGRGQKKEQCGHSYMPMILMSETSLSRVLEERIYRVKSTIETAEMQGRMEQAGNKWVQEENPETWKEEVVRFTGKDRWLDYGLKK